MHFTIHLLHIQPFLSNQRFGVLVKNTLNHYYYYTAELMDCVEQIETQTGKIIEIKRKYMELFRQYTKKVSKVLMNNILKRCSLKED